MTSFSASAPGKAILFGEHAVVYGQPAIAIPVHQISAKAIIKADILAPEGQISIQSDAIGLNSKLSDLGKNHPLSMAIDNTLAYFSVERSPAFKLKIISTIPVASGLGSGAAVSAAVVRAVAAFLGQNIIDQAVSEIIFESEKIYHGTPSGIDNTVVSFGKAVFFEKGRKSEIFEIGKSFSLIIADTGKESKTKLVVDEVRANWKNDSPKFDQIFKQIGNISREARKVMRKGKVDQLGELINENQLLLRKMDVSSAELETLIESAIRSGSLGAKLSGGGRGGNIIALAHDDDLDLIEKALQDAGAINVIRTLVQ